MSSSTCSKFGSLMTPTPIRTAAAIATSSAIWTQRFCLWRRTISQPASAAAAASQVNFMPPSRAGSPRIAAVATASGSSLIPNTVGPEPVTIGCSTPTARSASSAGSIRGHSWRAAGSRSLTYSKGSPARIRAAASSSSCGLRDVAIASNAR